MLSKNIIANGNLYSHPEIFARCTMLYAYKLASLIKAKENLIFVTSKSFWSFQTSNSSTVDSLLQSLYDILDVFDCKIQK